MYLCVLAFPFLSFVCTNFFGRYLGTQISCVLSTFSIFLSFIFSAIIFYEVAVKSCFVSVTIFCWISADLFTCYWGFFFDTITAVMFVVVCFVSCLVHFYACDYMKGDPHQIRFMGYLSLFTGFMLVLVAADNFVVMFLGWEGIGLASFLLISFWYTRIRAGQAGLKAMIVNRIGDLGLVLAICAIFLTFKSVDYATIFSLVPCVKDLHFSFLGSDFDRFTIISFLLFWGAVGKSAQIGLHIWLPDAMEGPTPVSALIHAATLVTAGIFLIIRCSLLFEQSLVSLFFITIMGALTGFFASSVGLVQNDLKRVIAYSTCSQLGYMVFACGLSHYSVALFHLVNHALFKALLFLSAGCIIHGISDEQDLRKMGGFVKFFPISFVMILIGSLSLTGIPFLTGFYSKDLILEVALSRYSLIGNFAYFLGCSAALFTSFYSWRLLFLTFINPVNSYKYYIKNCHEAGIIMLVPLFFLCFGSIFMGFFLKDAFVGLGTPFFENSVFVLFCPTILEAEFLNPFFKNLPLIFTLLGFTSSFLFIYSSSLELKRFTYNFKLKNNFRKIYIFLSRKWHFDQLVNQYIVNRLMLFGYEVTFQNLDKVNIEKFGPFGYSLFTWRFSQKISRLHTGLMYHNLFLITFGLVLITFVCFDNYIINQVLTYSVFNFLWLSYLMFFCIF